MFSVLNEVVAPRWRRDSNPRRRLCRPLPNHSATPPGTRSLEDKVSGLDQGRKLRADDGSRTRDPHHGKVMLYQLSYVRIVGRSETWSAVLRSSERKLYHRFSRYPPAATSGCFHPVGLACGALPTRKNITHTPGSGQIAVAGRGPRGGGKWICRSRIMCSRVFNVASAIGAAVARFVHTEEVTGSIPVSRTERRETRSREGPGFSCPRCVRAVSVSAPVPTLGP